MLLLSILVLVLVKVCTAVLLMLGVGLLDFMVNFTALRDTGLYMCCVATSGLYGVYAAVSSLMEVWSKLCGVLYAVLLLGYFHASCLLDVLLYTCLLYTSDAADEL